MIDETITLGKINRLRIDRFVVPGLFLMAEDESDLLLPNQYVRDDMQLDDELEVFVYTDSEDRLVATTAKPLAMCDEFGFFEVVDVAPFGAFVDWGLPKDLLVPKNRQKTPMKVGEKRFLRVIKDDRSDRLIGVEKISQYLDKPPMMHSNTPVSLLVIAKTPLGFKVIVDNLYEGLIYHDEIFQTLNIGDITEGFIKRVRKDGTIDISLQKIGKASRKLDDSDKIMILLEEKRGILPYNYKTDPETIKEIFGLSRKAFKRSLTSLIDAKKIEVNEKGIFKI
jgi:predicted RNA-binding protein (virulence factor B family)